MMDRFKTLAVLSRLCDYFCWQWVPAQSFFGPGMNKDPGSALPSVARIRIAFEW